MSDLTETLTVGSVGLTLAKIIWRRNGRRLDGVVEAALELNPHLAHLPPELPVGTVIEIPVINKSTTPVVEVVRLWD